MTVDVRGNLYSLPAAQAARRAGARSEWQGTGLHRHRAIAARCQAARGPAEQLRIRHRRRSSTLYVTVDKSLYRIGLNVDGLSHPVGSERDANFCRRSLRTTLPTSAASRITSPRRRPPVPDGEGRARVRNIMLAVGMQRAREPAAAIALMALQPGDAALDLRIVGRHASAAQNVDHEAGAIAVARLRVLRRAIATLPVASDAKAQPPSSCCRRRSSLMQACRSASGSKSGT